VDMVEVPLDEAINLEPIILRNELKSNSILNPEQLKIIWIIIEKVVVMKIYKREQWCWG